MPSNTCVFCKCDMMGWRPLALLRRKHGWVVWEQSSTLTSQASAQHHLHPGAMPVQRQDVEKPRNLRGTSVAHHRAHVQS
jgi:hypothetical protein